MGAKLVKLAKRTHARIPRRARELFVHMALTALDDGKPPMYFGGREAMAGAIYGPLDRGERRPEWHYREVSRSLVALERANFVRLTNKPHTGKRAEYALYVNGDAPLLEDQKEHVRDAHPKEYMRNH
jgi:hypothetical protein